MEDWQPAVQQRKRAEACLTYPLANPPPTRHPCSGIAATGLPPSSETPIAITGAEQVAGRSAQANRGGRTRRSGCGERERRSAVMQAGLESVADPAGERSRVRTSEDVVRGQERSCRQIRLLIKLQPNASSITVSPHRLTNHGPYSLAQCPAVLPFLSRPAQPPRCLLPGLPRFALRPPHAARPGVAVRHGIATALINR